MAKKSHKSQFGKKFDNYVWKEFFHASWDRNSFLLQFPINLGEVTMSKTDALAMRDALTKFLETV